MVDEAALRPMADDDVETVDAVMQAALSDLARRRAEPFADRTGEQVARQHRRLRHLLATDPAGAWVADPGSGPVGVGLALRRDGVWGLSLLMVDPASQGRGVGQALLRRTLEYAEGCRGGIIVSSPDPAAIRAYGLAGFRLLPGIVASGKVRREALRPAPGVRSGSADDAGLAAEVDRVIRGAAHGPDLARMLAEPTIRFWVIDEPMGRGYALAAEGKVLLLAATQPEAARRLLWAVLAEEPADGESVVPYLAGDQGWAVDVALAAGLAIRPGGPLFVRGELGPLTPYVPSGMYL